MKNTHPEKWTDQQLCDYIVEEGILTVDQLMALAPTRKQMLRLVELDELDKE